MNKQNTTSMTGKLSDLIDDKRVMVFIDGSNLYYSMHDSRDKFDFTRFLQYFASKCKLRGVHYYSASDSEDEKQIQFFKQLNDSGYQLHTKPLKMVADHYKGNMDVELAVDAVAMCDQYDTMVLLSGDGDFTYLCQKLKHFGKETVIISMGGFTAPELHENASNYFFLERIKSAWSTTKSKTIKSTKTKEKQVDDTENTQTNSIPIKEVSDKKVVRRTKSTRIKKVEENSIKIFVE